MVVVLMDYISFLKIFDCRCQKLSSRALQDSGSSVWTNWSPVGRLTGSYSLNLGQGKAATDLIKI